MASVVTSCSVHAPSMPSPVCSSMSTARSQTLYKVLVGVCQGDPLSPTLSGLFVEVLEQDKSVGSDWRGKVPDLLGMAVFMLLYADDVVLIANDPNILQAQLALEQYCHDWDMDVNLSKTNVVVFHRPGQARLGAPWKWLTATSTWAPCSKKPNSSSNHRSSWQQLVSGPCMQSSPCATSKTSQNRP